MSEEVNFTIKLLFVFYPGYDICVSFSGFQRPCVQQSAHLMWCHILQYCLFSFIIKCEHFCF